MTPIEARAGGALDERRGRGSWWSRLLVPVLSALLVLALGLLLVGLTGGTADSAPGRDARPEASR